MKKLITTLMLLALSFGGSLTLHADEINTVPFEEEVIYHTDFEGMTIDANNPPDNVTGFVWVNDFRNSKTVEYKGTTMFQMSLNDGQYSILGGLGIGAYGNLSKLKLGEPYKTSCYIELHNLEKLYVEFVGGNDHWGSVIIYPDGSTHTNFGDNMCQVSYVNNILNFTFTMAYNEVEKVNGYIKFTAYNSVGGYVYLDDVSIRKTEYSYNEDFSSYALGNINTTSTTFHGNLYTNTDDLCSTATIESDIGNKYLNLQYTPYDTLGHAFGYFNRFGFLNRGREYTMSFDLDALNLRTLYFYYGGTWLTPSNYFYYNFVLEEFEIVGDTFKNVSYNNGKLSFVFNVNNYDNSVEYKQFMLIGEAKNANQLVRLKIDNITILQSPKFDYLVIDDQDAKTRYMYGEELTLTGLKVLAIFTNGNSRLLNNDEYEVLGYDKFIQGRQTLTVKAQDAIGRFFVFVEREAKALTLDLTNVKVTYNYGENIDFTNLVVTLSYKDGGTRQLQHGATKDGYSIDLNGFDPFAPRQYEIIINYLDVSTSYMVEVLNNKMVTFDVTYS